MIAVRYLVTLGVLLTGVGFTSAAAPAVKLKAKKNTGIHGKVVEVNHGSSNSSTGSFKIHVHHKHHTAPKKSAAAAATKKKKHHAIHEFHVSPSTRFVRVVHEANGKMRHHMVSFRELKVGEHVVVHASGAKNHLAKRVAITSHHQKKKTPTAPKKKKIT